MLCTDQTLTSQAFWICSSHWKTLAGLGAQWHEHWKKNRCKYATQISLTHGWPLKRSNTTSCGAAFHFNEFTFLFLILFSHGKKTFLFLPVIVKPGCVARNDDVMGLLSHVVLVEVWAFHWLALHTRGAFLLFLLFIQTYSWAHQHRITAMILSYVLLIVKVPFLLFPWTRLLAHLLNHTKETRAWKGQ